MRILHVVRQFAPSIGGLEEVVAHLAKAQAAQGFRVDVVTLDRIFAAPDLRPPLQERRDGIDIVRIPFRGSTRYPLAPSVLRHVAEADIVHVHAIDFFFDFLALTRLWHRRPMLATTHGGFFHTQAYSSLKKIWFKTLTRASASRYDAIVACGESDRAMFDRIAADRVHLIENGVDTQKFAGCASPDPRKAVVTIGRFSNNKRLERLLATMSELVRRDGSWRLTIIGAQSDWSLERLKAEIVARGLEGHVAIEHAPDNRQIAACLGQASLFASASDHEGFGLVLIEALSAGLLPVVHPNDAFRALARRIDPVALADFTRPGLAADALEAAFMRLQENVAAAQARARAAAGQFEWSAVAARYGALYDDILARRRTAADDAMAATSG